MKQFKSIYSEKTVLVTGHTGFKGSWLVSWLVMLGAKVVGLSRDIPTEPSNFLVSKVESLIESNYVDIRDSDSVKKTIIEYQPDFIFHLAAQALVRPSYESPLETFNTNAIGSANLLDALRYLDKNVVVVMITSDKAYDNVEWNWGYRESDRLGGKDPYSASKGMAEIVIRSYAESFFTNSNVKIGVTRAGNVIGGGDWGIDRIVPDCMKAWSMGNSVDIRNPNSTRPWQHVLEPLSGYLTLGAQLTFKPNLIGEAYNFGPPANQHYSVANLIDEMSQYWENVSWSDLSRKDKVSNEAGLLKLNCDKALADLNWQPTLDFEETVKMTVEWYKQYYENIDDSMHDFSMQQIHLYNSIAQQKSASWA
jgi:CDP-glucose 4,6-dehydratase